MTEFTTNIRHSAQLKWNRVHKFRTQIHINIKMGPYTIKTAETREELVESFRLRHEVFNQEFRGIQGEGLDLDKFDFSFDHLIIIQNKTQKLIGTYRLNCTDSLNNSYTGLEFDLEGLREHGGPFLELGRACIKKEFRKGSVIFLLWRGIAEYMLQCGANILFGCSSVKISNARDAALVFKHLNNQDLVSMDFPSNPTRKFKMKGFSSWLFYFQKLTDKQTHEAEQLVPSLLKSYLKMGAQIACEPAFDKDFNCIDFLTILRKDDLDESLANKLQVVR